MTAVDSLLRDSARRILQAPELDDRTSAFDPRLSKAWNDLVEAGMTDVGIREDLGGCGGTFLDVSTLVFEMGRSASLLPVAEKVMLANWLNENSSRQNFADVQTVGISNSHSLHITRGQSGCTLDGVVVNVPWARHASSIIVSWQSDGEHLLIWLEPDDYVLETNENLVGEPRDTIVIRGIHIPAERFCPSPVSAQMILLRGALMRSISAAGSMISILDMTVSYARAREQFGRPLTKFQAVQQLLAQLGAEVYAAVVSTRAAVEAVQSGEGLLETLVAAMRVSQASLVVPRISHQIYGAIGVTEEDGLHRFTTRLWSWRSEYGDENSWSLAITNYVRERGGLHALWPVLTHTNAVATQESP